MLRGTWKMTPTRTDGHDKNLPSTEVCYLRLHQTASQTSARFLFKDGD